MALEAFEGLVSSSERGNPPDPKAFRASASSGDHRRMAVDVQDSFGEGAIQLVLPCDLEQDVHPAEVSAFEQESLEERVVDGKEAAFLAGVEREFVGLAPYREILNCFPENTRSMAMPTIWYEFVGSRTRYQADILK